MDLTEERIWELQNILRKLVDAVTFNGALTFSIARGTGVELPYSIEVINDRSAELIKEINVTFDAILEISEKDNQEGA